MSERARHFVESWIAQFVRPEIDEHPLNLFESRADAIACVHSALEDGISRLEIREEYGDLVFHIASARDRFAARMALPEFLGERKAYVAKEKAARDGDREPPSSGRLTRRGSDKLL